MTSGHEVGLNPDSGNHVNDPDKRRVVPNAALAVGQVLVSAATMFFLYRLLLSMLGVEALGVWSLVIATTSLASISNMGLAGGAVRFVSKYLAQDSPSKAASAVETSILSVAAIAAVVVLALWPVTRWLVTLAVPPDWAEPARELLPYTLAGLWLQSVGGTVLSGLDGCHRAGVRSKVTMATQPLILLFGVWLVPRLGLRGIAIAQLLQSAVWLVLGWILLRKYLSSLSRVPRRWSREMFVEMWRYGLNFQAITILTILGDPIAKASISHFGGLAALGYFEMANRLVNQIRSILIAANQVLIPYYSKVAEVSRETVRTIYQKNLSAVTLAAALGFSSLITLMPLISSLWIGRVEQQFLLFAVLLSVGMFIAALSVPAYFANLGGGWISRNLAGNLALTVAMIALGVAGGMVGGARGAVVGYCLSLIVGSVTVLGVFHRAEAIPIAVLFSKAALKTGCVGTAMATFGFVSSLLLVESVSLAAAMLASALVLAFGWALILVLVPELAALMHEMGSRIRPTSVADACDR